MSCRVLLKALLPVAFLGILLCEKSDLNESNAEMFSPLRNTNSQVMIFDSKSLYSEGFLKRGLTSQETAPIEYIRIPSPMDPLMAVEG